MPNSRIPDDRIDFWHFTPSRSSGATRLLACCLAFWALPCAYVPLDINTFAKQIAPSVARLFLMPERQNIHRIVGRFVVVQGHIARIPEGNH